MGKRISNNKYIKYSKDELINEIKRFVNEFKRIPISKDFEKLNGYPSRKTFFNIFGNFNDAIRCAGFKPIGINHKDNKIKYNKEYLSDKIFEFIEVYNKIPTIKEMNLFVDFDVKQYYTKIFGSWSKTLIELQLPLNQVVHHSNEFLESEFHRFVKENRRIPIFREFNNSGYPSFWCYQNRFGSWNNAVKAYGYEVQSDIYNFDNLSKQLIEFCIKIRNKENRNIILIKEIENCKEIASYSCFRKHLKKNGYSLKSFLNQYGFDILNEGCGLNYTFLDGEKVNSSYEYEFSNYLKNILKLTYNVDYYREIKYKDFITDYKGNMNCDYIINYNGRKIYIEVAGLLKSEKKDTFRIDIYDSKSKEKYRQKLVDKEKMFINAGLEYYILFTCDLNEEYLSKIFD